MPESFFGLTVTRAIPSEVLTGLMTGQYKPAKITSSLWGMVASYTGNIKAKEIDREKETLIPSFQKLVARNNVLEEYITQYELLEAQNVTPTEFESKLALLASTASVDGYIILQPVKGELAR